MEREKGGTPREAGLCRGNVYLSEKTCVFGTDLEFLKKYK